MGRWSGCRDEDSHVGRWSEDFHNNHVIREVDIVQERRGLNPHVAIITM